jgi:hypothetical protein
VRRVLVQFYLWKCFPTVPPEEQVKGHLKNLKENENVKTLISMLNEYLEQKQNDPSKSKRFLIETMIKNLDGTYF